MGISRLAACSAVSCVVLAAAGAACSSSNSGSSSQEHGDGGAGADAGTNPSDEGGAGDAETSDTDGGPITSGNPTGLWVAGLYAWSATALAKTGSPPPNDQCPIPNSGAASAPSAFDGQGNLWVQQATETEAILMWSPSELSAACSSGQPARTITLNLPEPVDQIDSMAFDSHGTLWMSCVDDAVLMGVTSAQLATTGTVTPTYFMQYGGTYAQALYAPKSLAFDATGNLWVGNVYSVLEYLPATLASAVLVDGGGVPRPTPDAYLSTAASEAAAQAGTSTSPFPTFADVAFDTKGNLWVTGHSYGSVENGEYIAEYAASALTQLATSTTPAPVAVILEDATQTAGAADFGALAFDGAGNLWVGSNADLFRYPAASLVPRDGGAPGDGGTAGEGGTYDVALTNLLVLTGKSLAFNPIPAGLPIAP
jgi:hypothetical protein